MQTDVVINVVYVYIYTDV